MNKLKIGLLLFCLAVLNTVSAQVKAISELIERVTPGYGKQFKLELVNGGSEDFYEIDADGGKIVLRGNNNVSIATAFNHYLKYYCNAHVSWFGNQLNLPKQLPAPKEKLRNTISGKYRMYMNYCTVSYTAAWWNWDRWQKELDYMAMNAINTPLFTVGLDAVWYNSLLRVGFSDIEARTFLAGPAHSAWQWMQNLQSYGGPLPKSWIDKHVVLGKQILERMLELGMTPIQQGFSGYVPREMKDKFPEAKILQQRGWCGFTGTAQLDPTDPLFTRFGKIFFEEEKKLFGAHGLYASDPFHESRPPVDTPEYLGQVGENIYKLMKDFNPQSKWVMQAWSLREHIVKAVPKDDLIILDLKGSKYEQAEGFWGYPFVVGNLHNFGGRINLHGDLKLIASNQYSTIKKEYPNVCGSGLFMEAIEQNPVFYDLAFEMPLHKDSVNISKWLDDYSTRRYGAKSSAASKAWMLLLEGPYREGTNGTERSSIIAARPAVTVKKSGPNAGLRIPYDPILLIEAEGLLLQDKDKLAKSSPYRFDVVDVQRQLMSNLGQEIHKRAANAFRKKDKEGFKLHSERFLEMLRDVDELLRTRPELNFDRWLTEARSWGETDAEKNLLESDATSLVTIWGSDQKAPRIFDYAWREWAGLIDGFYLKRWEMFYAMLQECLDKGIEYNEKVKMAYGREDFFANDFYRKLGNWELKYCKTYNKARTPITQGDEIEVVTRLYDKYLKLSKMYYKNVSREPVIIEDEGNIHENLGE